MPTPPHLTRQPRSRRAQQRQRRQRLLLALVLGVALASVWVVYWKSRA